MFKCTWLLTTRNREAKKKKKNSLSSKIIDYFLSFKISQNERPEVEWLEIWLYLCDFHNHRMAATVSGITFHIPVWNTNKMGLALTCASFKYQRNVPSSSINEISLGQISQYLVTCAWLAHHWQRQWNTHHQAPRKQWFSNLSMHWSYLESLLKYRFISLLFQQAPRWCWSF